jgi:selenobiotic family peptide radical SAM maturase
LTPHHTQKDLEQSLPEGIEAIYPICRMLLDAGTWDQIVGASTAEEIPDLLEQHVAQGSVPEFLPALARLEGVLHQVAMGRETIPSSVDRLMLNPTAHLLQLPWRNLPSLIHAQGDTAAVRPERRDEAVLAWLDPHSGAVQVRAATDEDLLVLKMVAEGISVPEVAAQGTVLPAAVGNAVSRGVANGLLLAPPSRIRRDPASFTVGEDTDGFLVSSPSFVLQWHITQACDLHCKHCYDRSDRSPLPLDQALRILDDVQEFCAAKRVRGYITFTGGNPLLYPHFTEVYRAASERGFLLAILGNPSPRGRIEELLAIQDLRHFQISLEGLPEHNDDIRGAGHFARSIEFLTVLRDLGVYSIVMLTLTKDNIGQVLPLAETLRGLTDSFTFNRLSQVGEGASLQLPPPDHYARFLEHYLEAAADNPVISLKDNLINILLQQRGLALFGGCTGFGCGAAFNFITLLADGEVHACRKFPSLIGNIREQGLAEIYDSEIARRYRTRSSACRACSLRPVCGGCMAVTYSHGLDVFHDRDPYCFIDSNEAIGDQA